MKKKKSEEQVRIMTGKQLESVSETKGTNLQIALLKQFPIFSIDVL